jgi:hypothetical protein
VPGWWLLLVVVVGFVMLEANRLGPRMEGL